MSYVGHESHEHKPGELLTAEERRKVMARIHSLFFWVGEEVPDVITIEGRQIPVRKLVYNFIHKRELSQSEQRDAKLLMKDLEKKEMFFERLLELHDISRDEAEEISHELLGIMRAIDELRSLEEDSKRDIEKRALMQRIEDEKRWLKFTKGRKRS